MKTPQICAIFHTTGGDINGKKRTFLVVCEFKRRFFSLSSSIEKNDHLPALDTKSPSPAGGQIEWTESAYTGLVVAQFAGYHGGPDITATVIVAICIIIIVAAARFHIEERVVHLCS